MEAPTGETGAMAPLQVVEWLEATAQRVEREGAPEKMAAACREAARLLQTLADPRCITLMCWLNGLRNATGFPVRCHLLYETYKATNAGWSDALSALRALADVLDAEDATGGDTDG